MNGQVKDLTCQNNLKDWDFQRSLCDLGSQLPLNFSEAWMSNSQISTFECATWHGMGFSEATKVQIVEDI